MKTHAIAALLVLGVVSSCGQDEATPTQSNSTTNSVETSAVAAKPELVPIGSRRVIELEGGVRVEILAEGQGDVVAPGDEVALSLTLSYVPKFAAKVEEAKPASAPADVSADDAKSSSAKKKDKKPRTSKPEEAKSDADAVKSDAAKSDTAKPDDAKPDDAKSDAAMPTEVTKSEDAKPAVDTPAPAEKAAPAEVAQASDAPPTADDSESASAKVESAPAEPATPDAKNTAASAAAPEPSAVGPDASAPAVDATAPAVDATAPADDATATAPAPEPLAAPLEPVVVLSTKNLGTPIRARVGASSTLVPGLSRALVGLRQGTIAEITLPAESAYGADGLPSAGIPPATPLLATIEIREVKR